MHVEFSIFVRSYNTIHLVFWKGTPEKHSDKVCDIQLLQVPLSIHKLCPHMYAGTKNPTWDLIFFELQRLSKNKMCNTFF